MNKKLIYKLMLLADRFPEGFTSVLPDGSLIKIQWLIGHEIEETPEGKIRVKQAFGMSLTGSDFDEVIITLYVKE
jgi:hypothetical protein